MGYWYCDCCNEEVAPENVTYQEKHEICGRSVDWFESDEDTVVDMPLDRTINITSAEKYVRLLSENTALKQKVAELKNPWISVRDRLPEEHDDVLIYYNPQSRHFPKARYMTQSSYYNGEFETLCWHHEVTHWQPLPKPPTESEVQRG